MAIRPFQQFTPSIDQNVYIDDMAVIIGNVTIAKDCSIWPFASVRGDIHHIQIGENTNIQDNCVLHVTHDSKYHPGGSPLIIGKGVTVGHHVTLHACTISNDCIIGMGSIVLDKAMIEPNVILAAGSLVSPGKVLESGYLWLGAPAVKKRRLSDEELAFIQYSAQNYVKLKNTYLGTIGT
ncbi:MAG: gamma carbonic anhydrase family protein [Proteobacteria bacterium]|nr:gamma carbonic anhydrase family protein [Pseudomonadota bacterium]